MNLVVLHKIFLVLFSVLGSIFTLLSFYRKKDPSGAPKTRWYYWTVLVCSLIVIIFYVVLGVYLEWINGDKVNATLRITIAEPRIVNVGGTESDPFYVNADYNVVAYRTRFVHRPTVQLTNIKTKETFIYHPSYSNVDWDVLYAANPVLNNKPGINLKQGRACTLVLPFPLFEKLYDSRIWDSMDNYEFFLRITYYPTAKDIRLEQ